MEATKKILLIFGVVLATIQFIHPAKNQSVGYQPNDILNRYAVSDTVKNLLRTACYDCHSNNTVYPWYSKVQPVDWWLDYHIKKGKRHLNFSEVSSRAPYDDKSILKRIAESTRGGYMPLKSYTFIHHDAKLSDAQRKLISAWANSTRIKLLNQKL